MVDTSESPQGGPSAPTIEPDATGPWTSGLGEPSAHEAADLSAPRTPMDRFEDRLAVIERVIVIQPAQRIWTFLGGEDERADKPEPGWMQFLRRPTAGPASVLVAMVVAYIIVFGTLTYRQQSNYGTFGFDMGIYDQGIWLVSHFKTPFDTIRGLNYFGHHVNLITLLFVPAYWLGAGPHFLFAIETVWLALGAVPIWLLGRDRLQSAWLPLGLSAAYLLYPSVEWINWWHFHPDALIIAPLMFAYWLASRRRWGWFCLAVGVTLSCKEDAALAVLALGLVLWLKHRQRAWGLLTSAAGAAWFLICTKLIIPTANGGGSPFYTGLFPGFGSSIFAIIGTLVFHPMKWLKPAAARSRWTYYAQVFWPVCMIALLEPLVLLVAAPQLLVNVISGLPYTHDIQFYYTSIIIAGVFLATVEAVARRGRTPAGKRFLVGLIVASALATNVAWSPSPIGVKFHSGIWAQPEPKDKAANAAIAMVPKNGSVTATYDIDDHMTHRTLIYEFPNPWVTTNWGINNLKPPDPSKVDWLVLNTTLLGTQAALYQDLISHEFEVVFNRQGIVVAHRVAPGIPNDHAYP